MAVTATPRAARLTERPDCQTAMSRGAVVRSFPSYCKVFPEGIIWAGMMEITRSSQLVLHSTLVVVACFTVLCEVGVHWPAGVRQLDIENNSILAAEKVFVTFSIVTKEKAILS